jgi:subfamily B ATP-binding cassette protein HlyB/CyaB
LSTSRTPGRVRERRFGSVLPERAGAARQLDGQTRSLIVANCVWLCHHIRMNEPRNPITGGHPQRESTVLRAFVRVAAHFGKTLNTQQLIRAHPFDTQEPGTALLMKMAERIGLRGKLLRIKRGELAKLARLVPAILLLPNGRAAVINRVQEGAGATCALIDDLESESGLSVLCDEPRLFGFWSGDVIFFKPRWRVAEEERPFGFGWFFFQVLKERKLVRDIGIAAIFMSILALFPPIAFMIMIDRVLYNRSMSTLEVLGVALVISTAFETLLGYLRRSLIWITTSRIDGRLNLHVFDKLMNLPMSFFESLPTGLINAKINQVWHIRQFMTDELFGTVLDSFTLLVLLPVLFLLNWKLAFLVIFLALCVLGIYVAFLPAIRRATGKVIEREQIMWSHQVETIHGMRTVKSLSLDGLKRSQRDVRVAEVVKAHQELYRLANIPQTIVHPLERLIYAGSFFLGCYMVLSDPDGTAWSGGAIVAFSMLSARVAAPIVSLAGVLQSFEQARGALTEVASVMNVPPEDGRSGSGLKLFIKGHVVFEEVRFRYKPGTPYALDGVTFEIPKNTIFGVMGRSGSGKTTVTRLLQGLNRDYEGMIKIDGMDLREIDLDHLRSNIGVVPQENFLFSGTIRSNICAARPNATFEEIVRVAQLAGAEEFIERLPHGYETVVEEGAVNFSGGQRQRLAIARALLVDPPILILDEATSALDAESEAIVNANLLRIAQGRTVIIISHRLSALAMADSILVLERGRFYAVGHHQKLLASCDIYRSLWSQQNRHLEAEVRNADREIPTQTA